MSKSYASANDCTAWSRVLKFDEIIRSEVLVDDQMISSKSAGGALVGGLLFGTTGAIVGSNTGKTRYSKDVNSVRLKLLVNDIANPALELPFYLKSPGKNTATKLRSAKIGRIASPSQRNSFTSL